MANVDQVIVVVSLTSPAPDWNLLQRQLVAAEDSGLAAWICLNKVDLVSPDYRAEVTGLLDRFPYEILFTSATRQLNLSRLARLLIGRSTVFAGPSGVGKSTLLNALQPGLRLKTGEISSKVKRGRHTTRAVELLPLEGGGTVVDTPGFSRLELPDLTPPELGSLFPEFAPLAPGCSFRDCLHRAEPGCAVRPAAREGKINKMRYQYYLQFLEELTARRRY